MRPLLYMTVGYITGIIWGLYLKTSIVPIFFIIMGIIYLSKKKSKNYIGIVILIIFALISNVQIRYLENKHQNLYANLDEIEIIGTIIDNRKRNIIQKKLYTRSRKCKQKRQIQEYKINIICT